MKHLNKHTSKILKLGVAGILFFSSFTFIEAKNPEPIIAKTPISNTSVMNAPQNLSADFFQSLKTAISKIQPTKALTTTSSETVGSFTVEGDTTGYSYTESEQGTYVLTFITSGNYTIKGDGKEVTNQTIAIGSDFEGTITLENVTITSTVASPFFVNNTAKLMIDLKGSNKLSTTNQKNATIDFSNATGDAHLTITSSEDGSLDCNNKSSSAAIGGGEGSSGNNITIAGGKITANSSGGAGIGGGYHGSGSNITITEGTVTAIGGNYGAGIGGGYFGSGSNITISDGTITATGGGYGAGIGSGNYGSGGNITITGGTVIATGGNGGAGIGANYGFGSNTTIEGGTVTATGGEYGEGINCGPYSNFKITGGSVKASSIDSTPIDENGADVYLVKLENQDNVNEAIIDNQNKFTRAGNHPDKDTAFYLYLTGENHTVTSNNITYRTIWQKDTDSFKVSAPSPTFTTTQTASSIRINLTNYQSEYGQVQYKWDEGDWGTSNKLSNLGANATHTVSVRYEGQGDYPQSVEQTQEVKTKSADYTITIPAVTLEAGKEESTSIISVNQNEPFDLGYNGKVNVKIKNDNTVTDKAELKLIRQNDTENHTITSALLVNGTSLGNINENVAVFTMSNKEPVSVSFAKPTEEKILAGTYKGTITFEVSYSDQ